MALSNKLFRIYFRIMTASFRRYKPTLTQFQNLLTSDQFYWISKRYTDYADLCLGNGYFGMSYPINDAEVREYAEQPEE